MANPTEQNAQDSIESTGGVPEIELEMDVFGMTQYAVDKTLSIADMAADAKSVGDAIDAVAGDLGDLVADVADLENRTGLDIPINDENNAPSIAEAIADIFDNLYPVGSLYITASNSLPSEIDSIGTWEEVSVPLTWNDAKKGTRSYAETDETFQPGNLHFWLRTE